MRRMDSTSIREGLDVLWTPLDTALSRACPQYIAYLPVSVLFKNEINLFRAVAVAGKIKFPLLGVFAPVEVSS